MQKYYYFFAACFKIILSTPLEVKTDVLHLILGSIGVMRQDPARFFVFDAELRNTAGECTRLWYVSGNFFGRILSFLEWWSSATSAALVPQYNFRRILGIKKGQPKLSFFVLYIVLNDIRNGDAYLR